MPLLVRELDNTQAGGGHVVTAPAYAAARP
jgi:hypothetical protein